MSTAAENAPTAAFDLYAHANGMMVIREKGSNGSAAWKSHPTGTSVEAKARKRFGAFLKKRGASTKEIDPLTVPIVTAVGPMPANSGLSVAKFIDTHKPKGGLPRGGSRPGSGRDYSREHAKRNLTAATHAQDAKALADAREVMAILAANMAAAALALKKLEEIVGDPP